MGWGGAHGGRALAVRQARLLWQLATDGCARGFALVDWSVCVGVAIARRSIAELGLAGDLLGQRRLGRRGPLYPRERPRDADVRTHEGTASRSAPAHYRGPARSSAQCLACDGRAIRRERSIL